MKPEDETAVWNIIEQPVGFVVLGSCCWARAMVINNLMGRNILPTVPLGETDTRWKMVSFYLPLIYLPLKFNHSIFITILFVKNLRHI